MVGAKKEYSQSNLTLPHQPCHLNHCLYHNLHRYCSSVQTLQFWREKKLYTLLSGVYPRQKIMDKNVHDHTPSQTVKAKEVFIKICSVLALDLKQSNNFQLTSVLRIFHCSQTAKPGTEMHYF